MFNNIRYSKKMLKALNLNPVFELSETLPEESCITLSDISTGDFRQIIDLLFSGEPSSNIDNLTVSESAPNSVKEFLSRLTLKNIPSVATAPDADTAIDMIIPKSVQNLQDFDKYVNHVKSNVLIKFNSSKKSSENG